MNLAQELAAQAAEVNMEEEKAKAEVFVKDIKERATRAAKHGKYNIYVDHNELNDIGAESLRDEGFVVTYYRGDYYEDPYWEVNWRIK